MQITQESQGHKQDGVNKNSSRILEDGNEENEPAILTKAHPNLEDMESAHDEQYEAIMDREQGGRAKF